MNEINVADAIKNREPKPEKYFLCFGFENFSPKDLERFHVTLIYFGELSDQALDDMTEVVNEFFRQGCYYPEQRLIFANEEMFGRNKDIRVLTPTDLAVCNSIFKIQFQTLRDRTEKFQSRQDFPFNPHLTTDLAFFQGCINKLYLCGRGYKVYKEWKLS